MGDISINSSQEKRSRTRKSLIHRFHKRRRRELQNTTIEHIDAIYSSCDSSDEESRGTNFIQFGEQMLLVAADKTRPNLLPTSSHIYRSNNFVKCDELPMPSTPSPIYTSSPQSAEPCFKDTDFLDICELAPQRTHVLSTTPDLFESGAFLASHHQADEMQISAKTPPFVSFADPESESQVTETQVLEMCVLAERQTPKLDAKLFGNISLATSLESPTLTVDKTLTPDKKRKKSIVDLILEDFCSSPSFSSPSRQTSPANTPVFQFRGEKIQTYQCKRRSTNVQSSELAKKPKLAQQLESRFEPYDDCGSSSSTCLSEQEDLTQRPIEACLIDLNKSQALSDNLMQLNSFFGTKSNDLRNVMGAESNMLDINVEDPVSPQKQLSSIEDDLTSVTSTNSSNQRSSKENENDLCDLDEWNDVFRDIETDDIFGLEKKTEISCAEAKSNEACHIDNNESDSLSNIHFTEWFYNDCDKHDNQNITDNTYAADTTMLEIPQETTKTINAPAITTLKSTHTLGSEHETGNDENIESIQFQLKDLPVGFKTASKKTIQVSDNAKLKASKLLDDLLQDENFETCNKHNTVEMVNEISSDHTTGLSTVPTFIGFQTAAKKSINVSDKAKEKAAKILENLPEISYKTIKKTIQTESNVSDNSKVNASKLLDDLLQDENFETFNKHDNVFNDIISDHTAELSTMPTFIGFQTAAKKSINVSDKAKEKAAKILENLPEIITKSIQIDSNVSDNSKVNASKLHDDLLKDKNIEPCNQRDNVVNDIISDHTAGLSIVPTFIGFQTAAKKSINVSDKAKEKAAKILETLPDITYKNTGASIHSESNVKKESKYDGQKLNAISTHQTPANKRRANSLDFEPLNFLKENGDNECSVLEQLDNANANHKPLAFEALPQTPQRNSTKTLSRSRSSCDFNRRKPFNAIDNCDQNMPSTSNGIISRKKKLSLTLRKKMKPLYESQSIQSSSNVVVKNTELNFQTPLKSLQPNEPLSPITPCPKHFDVAVNSTSTPKCISETGQSITTTPKHDVSGLQCIQWDGSDSIASGDTSSKSISRQCITRQRMAKLSSYGKAPSISPIAISAKSSDCRPSGLSRRRSCKQIVMQSKK